MGKTASDLSHEQGCRIAEIMTPDPVTISEDTPLEAIVALMAKNKLKRLPVMRGENLVGIVSRANLVRAVASLAREIPDPTAMTITFATALSMHSARTIGVPAVSASSSEKASFI